MQPQQSEHYSFSATKFHKHTVATAHIAFR